MSNNDGFSFIFEADAKHPACPCAPVELPVSIQLRRLFEPFRLVALECNEAHLKAQDGKGVVLRLTYDNASKLRAATHLIRGELWRWFAQTTTMFSVVDVASGELECSFRVEWAKTERTDDSLVLGPAATLRCDERLVSVDYAVMRAEMRPVSDDLLQPARTKVSDILWSAKRRLVDGNQNSAELLYDEKGECILDTTDSKRHNTMLALRAVLFNL